jgi:hypothetical protein
MGYGWLCFRQRRLAMTRCTNIVGCRDEACQHHMARQKKRKKSRQAGGAVPAKDYYYGIELQANIQSHQN